MKCFRACAVGGVLGLGFIAGQARGAMLVVNPSKDNTLFESATGAVSAGAEDGMFLARNGLGGGGITHRPVLAFSLAGIPAGAQVTGVTLTLHQSMVAPGTPANTAGVYRLTADWGEGASTGFGGAGNPAAPGDATWIHRFFSSQNWTTPGGDYVPIASATQTLGGLGNYSWSGPGLVADVQGWVNNPASNFGWIMIAGNEASATSARKLDSKENFTAANQPTLTVIYQVPEPGAAGLFATASAAALARRRAQHVTK